MFMRPFSSMYCALSASDTTSPMNALRKPLLAAAFISPPWYCATISGVIASASEAAISVLLIPSVVRMLLSRTKSALASGLVAVRFTRTNTGLLNPVTSNPASEIALL